MGDPIQLVVMSRADEAMAAGIARPPISVVPMAETTATVSALDRLKNQRLSQRAGG
jgi:hypothetical protein